MRHREPGAPSSSSYLGITKIEKAIRQFLSTCRGQHCSTERLHVQVHHVAKGQRTGRRRRKTVSSRGLHLLTAETGHHSGMLRATRSSTVRHFSQGISSLRTPLYPDSRGLGLTWGGNSVSTWCLILPEVSPVVKRRRTGSEDSRAHRRGQDAADGNTAVPVPWCLAPSLPPSLCGHRLYTGTERPMNRTCDRSWGGPDLSQL